MERVVARRAYLRVMASRERWPEASRAARPTAFPVCCCAAPCCSAAVGAIQLERSDSDRPERRKLVECSAATYG
jgi:hypothetical protein